MSATNNLDKGLDEIIASTGISSGGKTKSRAGRGFKKSRNGPSTKTLGKAIAAAAHAGSKTAGGADTRNKQKAKQNKAAPALPSGIVANPLLTAKRVVVSNLPLDINEQAVRQYFGNSIGKIREVIGSYRGDGTPSGTYTITFEKNGAANRMFEKFNNQPIDGGKSHLSVQILLDPTAVKPNTLKGRIGGASASTAPAASAAAGAAKKRRGTKRGTGKAADGNKPLKAVESQKAAAAPKSQKGKPKPKAKKPQRKARSTADLDAEMSDYFANAEKNEISV